MLQGLHRSFALPLFVGLSGAHISASYSQPPQQSRSNDLPAEIPRLALVVGMENYDRLPPVTNALSDARAMESLLSSAGFGVTFLPDPITEDVLVYMKGLALRAGGPDQPAALVFYFAGHGFQHGGQNYLVPKNAGPGDLLDVSLAVRNLLTIVERRRAGIVIFILDACRTPSRVGAPSAPNPNAAAATLDPPGFALFDVTRGALFALASKANRPARSGATENASNSPYTTALMRYLPGEGLAVDRMFDKVQILVEELTARTQSPEVVKDTGGMFFFHPTDTDRGVEASTWQAALKSGRGECVARFVEAYPDSRYVNAALRWMSDASNPIPIPGGEECPDK